jgi:hypothetical protein
MDPTKGQRVCIRFCANLGQNATETRQRLDKHSGKKQEPYTESLNSPCRKKARQLKGKAKSMLIIFFDIKRIVHKEFVQAGQTVSSTYCCDVLRRLRENARRLRLELWQQKNWLLYHDNAPSHTSFSTREFLAKNNMNVVPRPTDFSVSPIEDKAERPPF